MLFFSIPRFLTINPELSFLMKKILQYAISLTIAGGLLWYVFKDIDLSTMVGQFKKANYWWIVVSGFAAIIAHLSRAVRWKMLMEPLGYNPSNFRTLLAVLIGYFANFIMPRMGEVSKCGSLQKTDNIPFEKSFGTVVAERIFDLISLLVLLALNLLLEFGRLKEFFVEQFSEKIPLVIGILVALPLLGFAGVYFFKKYQDRLVQKSAFLKKVIHFMNGLLDGLLSIKKLKSPGLFIAYTVLIWVAYYFSAYVLFFSIPETSHLGPLAGLTVLVIGSLGMAAPAQGGIGPFHFLVGNILVLYGLTKEAGITLATFIHGSQMLLLLFLGAISFLITLFLKPKTSAETAVS